MRRSPFPWLLALLLAALAAAWVGVAARTYRIGFPLDDAWIHQTFARNLARRGEWAFLPGHPSAGSTGPLWGALLAMGYLLHLPPLAWTFVLGLAALWGMAALTWRAWPILAPERAWWRVAPAVTLVLAWHMLWAALSGMETVLFAFMALALLLALHRTRVPWFWCGAWVGLTCWVRPDGLTLLLPLLLVAWKRDRRGLWRAAAGFLALFLPYLAFNWLLDGRIWPNTFYAKQAEYAVLRKTPFPMRLFREYLPLVTGVGVLLAPGLALAARRRRWPTLVALAWALGYPALYAWRLPVIYQHGRYVVPALPVWIVLGWVGMVDVIRLDDRRFSRRVLSRAWLAALLLIGVWFLGLGAQAYARDVALIESEMVDTARWIAANTPAEALIAAHDIGALGYYAQRPVLDLAGLVSPEVIPFLRDEARLAAYLDRHEADYLMTFPGWYPKLVDGLPVVYRSGGRFSPLLGGENMAVFRWRRRAIP